MEMTYQLIDQLAAAGATGQTGAKREAGTREKSDGSFDTMVRQRKQEADGTSGTSGTTGTGNEAPAAETEEESSVTYQERIAMAAAMLLQPQPEIVYVPDTAAPVEELGTEAVSELLPEQAAVETEAPALPEQAAEVPVLPEQAAETGELPAQTLTERPAEAAAQSTEERPAETERFQPVQTDEAPAETVTAKAVTADRESAGAELTADAREGEREVPAEASVPETPVFGYMSASPVKVAASETARPLALEAGDAAEELSARIESVLTDVSGDTKVELSLSPASLGKLTVEFTRSADGSLHLQLFAATEKAAALLEKNAGALQNLLAAKDRPQTTVEVRFSESAQQKFLDPNGQRQNQNGAYQQQQQQQRGRQREALRVEDFMSRLRLGLVDLDAAM